MPPTPSRASSRPPGSARTRPRSREASCRKTHALAFLNARVKAFADADVLLVVGSRFNFVIQFGRPPRFAADLRVIHVDINPTELGHNRTADVPIAGDARAVLEQLAREAAGRIDPRPLPAVGGKAPGDRRREAGRDGAGPLSTDQVPPSAAAVQGSPRLHRS